MDRPGPGAGSRERATPSGRTTEIATVGPSLARTLTNLSRKSKRRSAALTCASAAGICRSTVKTLSSPSLIWAQFRGSIMATQLRDLQRAGWRPLDRHRPKRRRRCWKARTARRKPIFRKAGQWRSVDVRSKSVSQSDPAAQWTGALRGPAFFAYADN